MEDRARQLICCTTMASALMLLLLGDAAAQKSQLLKNVELCNGADRTSPDIQIEGCSALINSGEQTPQALVIAYNNFSRGNAYTTKGDYDRAVQDYDQSIKLDPGYARAFNNRGVAYQKKGSMTARSVTSMRRSSSIQTMSARSRTVPKHIWARATTNGQSATLTRQSGLSRHWKPCGTDVAGPKR